MSARKIRVELTEAQIDVLAAAVAQAEVDWEDDGNRDRDIATLNRAWDAINRARHDQIQKGTR